LQTGTLAYHPGVEFACFVRTLDLPFSENEGTYPELTPPALRALQSKFVTQLGNAAAKLERSGLRNAADMLKRRAKELCSGRGWEEPEDTEPAPWGFR
jgi:hypothetical protein